MQFIEPSYEILACPDGEEASWPCRTQPMVPPRRKQALPALLSESRKRQANVTNELAEQVFQALQILLAGFEAAAERDGRDLLDDALARENDHLYKGLLAVLLRMVFLLYAEDRSLLPTEHPLYAEHLSVLGLLPLGRRGGGRVLRRAKGQGARKGATATVGCSGTLARRRSGGGT